MERRRLLSALVILLVACGGAPAAPARPPHPPGPAMSFLHVPHTFLLRVDCAAIRTTPIADDVAQLWRDSPLFQRLASDASFDPVRDLDVMVATTGDVSSWHGGPSANRWRIVIRHHRDAVGARALLGGMASAQGDALVWREGQGFASAILPGEISRDTPHAIALTALHEAVVAPDDELSSIMIAARDQAARRDSDLDLIEPGLAAVSGELVRAETTSPPPFLASVGTIAARGSVLRAGQGAAVHLELDFRSTSEAQGLAAEVRAELPSIAQNPLVTILGLSHPLTIAQVTTAGTTSSLDTRATFDELRAGLRAIAMVSGGRP